MNWIFAFAAAVFLIIGTFAAHLWHTHLWELWLSLALASYFIHHAVNAYFGNPNRQR